MRYLQFCAGADNGCSVYADRLDFLGSLWLDLYFQFAVCSRVSFDSRHIPQVSYTFCRDKVMLVPIYTVHCMCFLSGSFFFMHCYLMMFDYWEWCLLSVLLLLYISISSYCLLLQYVLLWFFICFDMPFFKHFWKILRGYIQLLPICPTSLLKQICDYLGQILQQFFFLSFLKYGLWLLGLYTVSTRDSEQKQLVIFHIIIRIFMLYSNFTLGVLITF